MADNAIHWINLYPLDSAIGFPNHPLDSDLSGFDRLPWPVNSAIQLLPNNWRHRSASISFSFPDSSVYVAAEFLHYSVT